VEQCNFYIPFLIAFPPPVQNISTALFCLDTIVFMCQAGTGKTPKEGMNRASFGTVVEAHSAATVRLSSHH
jgi:hypothetical protein